MNYHITMLCGGKSMMLAPSERRSFDLKAAAGLLGESVLRSSDDMLEFMYRDVKITIYPNGSVMFYHFTDADAAKCYAKELSEMIERR